MGKGIGKARFAGFFESPGVIASEKEKKTLM